MADTLQLGGSIELTGFSELEPAIMVVVKKIVGNYTKRLSKITPGFQGLHLTVKKVHNKSYEIQAKLVADKIYASDSTDINLFVTLDNSLKKIENEISK
ncbi:MAG: hypothetical protein ABIF10_08315 [Candidatus Woesearchaeota archaeon]